MFKRKKKNLFNEQDNVDLRYMCALLLLLLLAIYEEYITSPSSVTHPKDSLLMPSLCGLLVF